MKDSIDSDVLYAQILMMRGVDNRHFFFVEGQTDADVLEEHIDKQNIDLSVGFGKQNLLELARKVQQGGILGVVFLVDRDIVDFGASQNLPENVFLTDYSDLDATIFFAQGVCESVARHFSLNGDNVSTAFLERKTLKIASYLGRMRYVSQAKGLDLSISRFPFEQFMVGGERELDLEGLCKAILAKSKSDQVALNQIVEAVKSPINGIQDNEIINGHDLIRAFTFLAKYYSNSRISYTVMESVFRVAYKCRHLMKTRFYRDISNACVGVRVWCCPCVE